MDIYFSSNLVLSLTVLQWITLYVGHFAHVRTFEGYICRSRIAEFKGMGIYNFDNYRQIAHQRANTYSCFRWQTFESICFLDPDQQSTLSSFLNFVSLTGEKWYLILLI